MKTRPGFVSMFLLFGFITSMVHAQQPTFTKVFYDTQGDAQGYAIVKTYDQNYMIAGDRDGQAMVMKTDQSGNVLWMKKFGNIHGSQFNCIIGTHDSCSLAAGYMPTDGLGSMAVFCAKLTSTGDTLWTKTIMAGGFSTAMTVEQTSDHGFILAGYLRQSGTPMTKIIVVKLDPAGNIQWSQFLSGGNQNNRATAIREVPGGGYILTGDIENYPPYSSSAILIRLSETGVILWSKKADHPLTDYYTGMDVVVTPTGFLNYLDIANNGTVLMKTDLSGNFIWGRKYSTYTTGSSYQFPTPRLYADSDGGYFFTTTGWGGQPLIRVDTAGNILWSQSMTIIATDVAESPDNGYMMLGNGPIMGVKMGPTDNLQIGIIKTDSLGSSSDCVMPDWIASDTCTILLSTVSFTATSGAVATPSNPMVFNSGMSIFEGCVEVTGSTAEITPGEDLFRVGPTPSDGRILVTPGRQPILKLDVYNVAGEKIYGISNPVSHPTWFDLTRQPAGMYYVRARLQSETHAEKILIVH
jgi:hypothetical protein